MSSSSKIRKIVDKRRVFQEKLEELYFVTAVDDISHCLVCQKSIAVMKEYNMRRHYETMHKDEYDGYKGEARKEKLKRMKSSLCKQRSMLTDRDVAAAPQTPQLGGARQTLGAQVSLKLLFGYVTIFSSADLFTTDLNCRKKLACDIISECNVILSRRI